MDDAIKKEALRLFTYGLYVVTCGVGDERNAFTANWLAQVSFEPPLVALSVENASASLAIIRRAGGFVVNVLGADQRELAGRLGRSLLKHPQKLDGLAFGQTKHGAPTLLETLASVECVVESEAPAGDSTLLIGRVIGAEVRQRGEPLTMLAAGFKHAG